MEKPIDKSPPDMQPAERLTSCLSMVAHHEEVQVMLAVIQELLEVQEQETCSPERGD